jgi:hypothetical protein
MKPSFVPGTEAVRAQRGIAGYALIFGVCALFILINTTTLWFSQRFGWMGMRESSPWALLLLEQIMWWLPVVLLAPAILLAGRRFRLERRRWPQMLPAHLALSLVYAALFAADEAVRAGGDDRIVSSSAWDAHAGAHSDQRDHLPGNARRGLRI